MLLKLTQLIGILAIFGGALWVMVCLYLRRLRLRRQTAERETATLKREKELLAYYEENYDELKPNELDHLWELRERHPRNRSLE